MWTNTVAFRQIRDTSRWKVEFFCETAAPDASHAFELVALHSLVEERKETLDPQAYPNRLFNYVGLEQVQSATGDLINFQPRAGSEIRSRSKVYHQGDILYGRLRPYLNKVYVAEGDAASGICSGEFYILTPRLDRVLPLFLRTVLSSEYVQRRVRSLQTGSALPRLPLRDLLEVQIPLPPLDMQRSYETFLAKEAIRRRRLAAELAMLPQATLDAVTQALASGAVPQLSALSISDTTAQEVLDVHLTPKARGKPKKQLSLFVEATASS